MSDQKSIQADRNASAEWLREIADKIEDGEVKSVFTVAVLPEDETTSRLSLLVAQEGELSALAELLFYVELYRERARDGIAKVLLAEHSRGGEKIGDP